MPVKFFTLFPCLNLPLYRQPNRKSRAFVFALGKNINRALMEFNNIIYYYYYNIILGMVMSKKKSGLVTNPLLV